MVGRRLLRKKFTLFLFGPQEAWESFPELPGEHLRWHQTARRASEIVTRNGQVLATVEGLNLFPPWPLLPKAPRRVTIDQRTYQVESRIMNPRIITPEGLTVLSFTGTKNFDYKAKAAAHISNGPSLRFPVHGTSKLNAVMTATDAGKPVFRVRQVRNARPEQKRRKVVEILVEPGRQITPELLLVMATGYYNLATFFDHSSGG